MTSGIMTLGIMTLGIMKLDNTYVGTQYNIIVLQLGVTLPNGIMPSAMALVNDC